MRLLRDCKLLSFWGESRVGSVNLTVPMKTLENSTTLASVTKSLYYARLDEKDLAIEWLSRAADGQDNTATWANVYPDFDSLRDDPRFHDLLP